VSVLAAARAAWEQRLRIEEEAAVRFGVLAERLAQAGAPGAISDQASRAANDEARHARHCQTFVTRYGGAELPPSDTLVEYAPPQWPPIQRLVYELVAQGCIAETQSTATLVTLLRKVEDADLRTVLHELARDEVGHGRLGWATLGWARGEMSLAFLAPLLPSMIQGSAGPELFTPAAAPLDSPELFHFGVVPTSVRRQVYVETLESVILPGFEQFGVDTEPTRKWLASARSRAG
jgi:hypothetical protein